MGVCRELGIGFVAYSPRDRGFLTGRFQKFEDLPADDYRWHHPRFEGDNFQRNMALVKEVEALAQTKQCTASQIALALVLTQGPDIVLIPGTKRRQYLEQNVGALDVKLSNDELLRLERVFAQHATTGDRYPKQAMAAVNR